MKFQQSNQEQNQMSIENKVQEKKSETSFKHIKRLKEIKEIKFQSRENNKKTYSLQKQSKQQNLKQKQKQKRKKKQKISRQSSVIFHSEKKANQVQTQQDKTEALRKTLNYFKICVSLGFMKYSSDLHDKIKKSYEQLKLHCQNNLFLQLIGKIFWLNLNQNNILYNYNEEAINQLQSWNKFLITGIQIVFPFSQNLAKSVFQSELQYQSQFENLRSLALIVSDKQNYLTFTQQKYENIMKIVFSSNALTNIQAIFIRGYILTDGFLEGLFKSIQKFKLNKLRFIKFDLSQLMNAQQLIKFLNWSQKTFEQVLNIDIHYSYFTKHDDQKLKMLKQQIKLFHEQNRQLLNHHVRFVRDDCPFEVQQNIIPNTQFQNQDNNCQFLLENQFLQCQKKIKKNQENEENNFSQENKKIASDSQNQEELSIKKHSPKQIQYNTVNRVHKEQSDFDRSSIVIQAFNKMSIKDLEQQIQEAFQQTYALMMSPDNEAIKFTYELFQLDLIAYQQMRNFDQKQIKKISYLERILFTCLRLFFQYSKVKKLLDLEWKLVDTLYLSGIQSYNSRVHNGRYNLRRRQEHQISFLSKNNMDKQLKYFYLQGTILTQKFVESLGSMNFQIMQLLQFYFIEPFSNKVVQMLLEYIPTIVPPKCRVVIHVFKHEQELRFLDSDIQIQYDLKQMLKIFQQFNGDKSSYYSDSDLQEIQQQFQQHQYQKEEEQIEE